MYVVADDGTWVSERFERLARIIKDYDPNLELAWIPPDKRTREDRKPYAIMDTLTRSPVMFAGELDEPVDILARLFDADNAKGDVLSRLEANNAAAEAMELKARLDEQELAQDQVAWLVGSKKNYVKFNGKKLDDQRRPIL